MFHPGIIKLSLAVLINAHNKPEFNTTLCTYLYTIKVVDCEQKFHKYLEYDVI